MRKINKTYKLLFSALIILIGSSCIHIETTHHGTVTDAETGKPLEKVVVYDRLTYVCFFPPNPAGPNSEPLGNISATSNAKGEYILPFKIYMLPPLFCSVSKVTGFIKPGYLEYGYGFGEPWDKDLKDPYEIKLFKMTHYLNTLPYIEKDKYHYSFEFENVPRSYVDAFNTVKNMKATALDDLGIFVRTKNRCFTRIYYLKNYKKDIICAYDNFANEWVLFNTRGKIADKLYINQPKWLFESQHGVSNWTIYADNKNIYYYPYYNPMEVDSNYKKDDIITIPAKRGDLSDIAGYEEAFLTIENNGQSLCHYGKPKKIEDKSVYIGELRGSDLPSSSKVDSSNSSKFMSLNKSGDSIFLLTQSNTYWHLYHIKLRVFNPITRDDIKEIGIIPIDKEITAFASNAHEYGGNFYLAIKNEGIQLYKLENGKFYKDMNTSEVFNKNLVKNISSMSIGFLTNLQVIYAVSDDDRIFRFTLDGIPDYPIALEGQ